MSFIVPEWKYYLGFGFAIALCMYFTLGLFYVNKLRPNIEQSAQKQEVVKTYSNKEKLTRLLLFGVGMIAILVIEFIVTPNVTGGMLTKTFAFGVGSFAYLTLATLDLKKGEVYVYELGFTNTLCMFVLPVIVCFIFGCPCIAKALLITFGAYIVLKVINYFFNQELSIGGADIDTIASLVAAVIATYLVIEKRESTPIFMETFYLETLFTLIFINFTASILGYFIVRAVKTVKKKNSEFDEIVSNGASTTNATTEDASASTEVDSTIENTNTSNDSDSKDSKEDKKEKKRLKMNFRCLPSFILIYNFVLFTLLFY